MWLASGKFVKSVCYVFLFITVSFILLLLASSVVFNYIKVLPVVGISECKSYSNGSVDISSCKVLPGSLGIMVVKDAPFFSYLDSNSTQKLFSTLSLYSLVLFIASFVAFSVSIYYNRVVLAIFSLVLALVSIFLATLFSAPIKSGDIICYKSLSGDLLICHTLVGIDDRYVYLKPSRYGVIEKVPRDRVVGKLSFVANPLYGKMLILYRSLSKLAMDLLSAVYKGYVPTEFKVYYLVEP